jgi:hypothetical protein
MWRNYALSRICRHWNWAQAGSAWSETAASSRLSPQTNPPPILPAQAGEPRGGLPHWAASINPVVSWRWWWILNHPAQSTLTLLPLPPPPNHSQSPIEEISDLLENLPTSACLQLTSRLLSTASSLPTGKARPRAVLKTVILFLAEHGGAA